MSSFAADADLGLSFVVSPPPGSSNRRQPSDSTRRCTLAWIGSAGPGYGQRASRWVTRSRSPILEQPAHSRRCCRSPVPGCGRGILAGVVMARWTARAASTDPAFCGPVRLLPLSVGHVVRGRLPTATSDAGCRAVSRAGPAVSPTPPGLKRRRRAGAPVSPVPLGSRCAQVC